MTAFDAALAVWKDHSDLKLVVAVWKWHASDGTPRDRVTLVCEHDGALVGGCGVNMAVTR